MKKSIISSGALALALALFTTGCSWFESSGPASQDGFYRPLNHAGKNSGNRNPGDADLNGFGNGGLGSATHPSDYADGSEAGGEPIEVRVNAEYVMKHLPEISIGKDLHKYIL